MFESAERLLTSVGQLPLKHQNTRRGFMHAALGLVFGTIVANGFTLPETAYAGGFRIENIPSEPGRGTQSFPWLPIMPEAEAGGTWWFEVLDKYDLVDDRLNELKGNVSNSRNRQWRAAPNFQYRSTRQLMEAVARAQREAGEDPYSSGFCRDSAVASSRCRTIGGGIDVLGVWFDESERRALGTLAYAGCNPVAELPGISLDLIPQLQDILARDGVVVGDFSTGQGEWWILLNQINGRVVDATRFLKTSDTVNRVPLSLDISSFRKLMVIDSTKPDPKRKGNYDLINGEIAGLVLGFKRVVLT